MSRNKGLMSKLKDEDLIKEKLNDNSFLFSSNENEEEEFDKIRQTIYIKENLAQAVKYKAFVENTSMTEIFNDLLSKYLSTEEILLGSERARNK